MALGETSPTQIEFKSFPSIMDKNLLVFTDVVFYKIWLVLLC
jgi:hypothetical protein